MAFTTNHNIAQTQPSSPAPSPSHEVKESGQGEVFVNLVHTVAALISKNTSIQHAVGEIAQKERFVDVTAFTALAQSARVHLTQDNRMVLSYTMGDKVYNHQMTAEEYQKLNLVLTDTNTSNHEKMHGIASVFSKISIASNAGNRFENDNSASQTIRNSFYR